MSNESAVENLEGRVNAQGLRIADLETFTEKTHDRVNDIEALRDAVSKLQLEFMEERNRVNAEFVKLEIQFREAVVDAIGKITAQLIANSLRDDVVETIKKEITTAATVLASTVIATCPATRDELRGKKQ